MPRPGVWSSPLNLISSKTQPRSSLPSLKNACTVEELEKGLIGNRPPPGLGKPQTQQQQKKSDGSIVFDALSINDKLQINGVPPRFPPGLSLPPHPLVVPNIRLPHSQFLQPRVLLSKRNILTIIIYYFTQYLVYMMIFIIQFIFISAKINMEICYVILCRRI